MVLSSSLGNLWPNQTKMGNLLLLFSKVTELDGRTIHFDNEILIFLKYSLKLIISVHAI